MSHKLTIRACSAQRNSVRDVWVNQIVIRRLQYLSREQMVLTWSCTKHVSLRRVVVVARAVWRGSGAGARSGFGGSRRPAIGMLSRRQTYTRTLATDVLPLPCLLFTSLHSWMQHSSDLQTLSFGSTLQDAISTIKENLKQLKSDV